MGLLGPGGGLNLVFAGVRAGRGVDDECRVFVLRQVDKVVALADGEFW